MYPAALMRISGFEIYLDSISANLAFSVAAFESINGSETALQICLTTSIIVKQGV